MQNNPKFGIFLMILTTLVFAVQDGISQHLATEYNVLMVVMIRYWFFAAFVIALANRKPGGCANRPIPASPHCKSFAERFWRWKSASWSAPSSCWG